MQRDVVIIGAGISGIGMACHMRKKLPGHSFEILERRDAIGGTWDLFRYPGIRSDSDMYTFGYTFKPWTEGEDIASAASIRNYLKETVDDYDLKEKIHFSHSVETINWSISEKRWHVEGHTGETPFHYICKFLVTATGYYNYDQGYLPEFEGFDDFKGQVVHPQHWPESLDYKDKSVLVIGSGATAVTLVPAMAGAAKHVTMLQRSPTYIFTRPAKDKISNALRKILPLKIAYRLARFKNITMSWYLYQWSRKKPEKVRAWLRKMTKAELGDSVDVDTHFNPTYAPWDQRLCLIPDSDLFNTLKDGSASIVTDHVDRFTKTGVRTKSGQEINADIIVPATGLQVQFLGGIIPTIDGERGNSADLVAYKGMMFGNVPNMAAIFGYTNASWTLKADLTADYVCRLLKYMDKNGHDVAMPKLTETEIEREPLVGLQSGYLLRADHLLPKQGTEYPWRNKESYFADYKTIKLGKINDGVMVFG